MKHYEKIKKFLPAAILLPVVFGVLLVFYLQDKEKMKQAEELKKTLTTEQILKEEYTFQTEGNITYTFRADGILLVEGNGKTKEFSCFAEGQDYFLTSLYTAYTGTAPAEKKDAEAFLPVMDRVTSIVLGEGITEVGNSAFCSFTKAEQVTLPESLHTAGAAAFLGTGQDTGKEVAFTGKNRELITQTETSFLSVHDENFAKVLTGQNDAGEPLLRKEEERGTVPALPLLVNRVSMGENVYYELYDNGVLVVSGSGATYDFCGQSDAADHLKEELSLATRNDVAEQWFNKVTEILVTKDVDKIGDYALNNYKKTALVTVEAENVSYGRYAFGRCGALAAMETTWDIETTDTQVPETAFAGCRGEVPVKN